MSSSHREFEWLNTCILWWAVLGGGAQIKHTLYAARWWGKTLPLCQSMLNANLYTTSLCLRHTCAHTRHTLTWLQRASAAAAPSGHYCIMMNEQPIKLGKTHCGTIYRPNRPQVKCASLLVGAATGRRYNRSTLFIRLSQGKPLHIRVYIYTRYMRRDT